MRLLFIGINYAPEETGIAPYTTGMAQHFAGLGHQVTVLTGMPHYPSWRLDASYKRGLWNRERVGDVDVIRIRHYVPNKQSAIRRGLYEATFLLGGAMRLGLQRPDAVIGVVPSLSGGVLARLAGRRFGVPYGLLFQDLMGPAASESGIEGAGRVAKAVSEAERWAVSEAAGVAVITDGFRRYVQSIGVAPDRIMRVRNWTHIDTPKMPAAETRRRLGLPEDAFICLHAGNMGYKQGLENVVEAARLAQEQGDSHLFVLVGDGNRRLYLEALVDDYGLNNVRFLPIQPKESFADLLGAADVLLINQKGSVTDMSLPGKLTSYFFAGRPVVAAVSSQSETAVEINASGGGLLVPADEPQALLEGLRQLAADEEQRAGLGEAAAAYAFQHLTADSSLKSCELFVEAVAAAGRQGITTRERDIAA